MFTKKLIDVYQERIRPTKFLQSYFPSAGRPTSKLVSIEVERGFEKIAVDVVRGADGHRNRISRSTEKIILPPLYDEFFDATELDLYDRVLGSQGDNNVPVWPGLLSAMADRTGQCQDKIERAMELQCAQILFTGIVQLKYGTNIDFKRKSESIVDLTGAGGYWDGAGDPFVQMAAGGYFLRTVGKSIETNYHVIMAGNALDALLNNTIFKARQNMFHLNLDSVKPPKAATEGAAYHGRITGRDYTFDLFTYPQVYDDPDSADPNNPTFLPYIPSKYATIVPANPRFKTAFGLVPQLINPDQLGQVIQQNEFMFYEWPDYKAGAHLWGVKSAPIAVPVAVDQMYTMKVLA